MKYYAVYNAENLIVSIIQSADPLFIPPENAMEITEHPQREEIVFNTTESHEDCFHTVKFPENKK